MKVVSSAKIKSPIKAELQELFPEVSFFFFANIDEAGKDLADAEILITYGEDLSEHHIEQAKALKWIMVISAGLDKMPFSAIEKRNILVTNAKGIHRIPMAEYTLSMILQHARKADVLLEKQKQKAWDRRVPMTEIHDQTIGILGAGAIGAEIARLAKAFGMKTLGLNRSGATVDYVDRTFTYNRIGEFLADVDYLVSVLPSTDDTADFMDMEKFTMMKKEAVFINIGRGMTVKEEDLMEALSNGVISHAILDVFKTEPLPMDHPFWEMENVTVTPHISGISAKYQPRAFEIFITNLRKYLAQETDFLNIIDVRRGY